MGSQDVNGGAVYPGFHLFTQTIRVDQGCQFMSKELDLGAYANGITLNFNRLGKTTDNAYAESFNASVRLECLGRIGSWITLIGFMWSDQPSKFTLTSTSPCSRK